MDETTAAGIQSQVRRRAELIEESRRLWANRQTRGRETDPVSPREGLSFLIRFAEFDLPAWLKERPEDTLEDLWRPLWLLQTGRAAGPKSPASADVILEAHAELRECLSRLATAETDADFYTFYAPRIQWIFKRPNGSRRVLRSSEVDINRTQLAAGLVFKAIDLIDAVGADRLKACPYRPADDVPACGKLFIATRRQKFCTTDHARRASWLAWITKHGGIRPEPQVRRPRVEAGVRKKSRPVVRSLRKKPAKKRRR